MKTETNQKLSKTEQQRTRRVKKFNTLKNWESLKNKKVKKQKKIGNLCLQKLYNEKFKIVNKTKIRKWKIKKVKIEKKMKILTK